MDGVDRNLGADGGLIGIVNAREVFDLTGARAGVHPFWVASLANFQRRIHEHFDEATFANHGTTLAASGSIGTDCSTYHSATVAHNLGSNVSDAPDICVSILLAEIQTLRKMRTHHITVQEGDLPAVFKKLAGDDICRCRFAGTAQSCKPQTKSLSMSWWMRTLKDRRYFRPGGPRWQR